MVSKLILGDVIQDSVFGIVQKVFSEKALAKARMRQKCVKNASKWVLFYWEKRGTFQNASEMHQNCSKNASKMRRTPLGENTFWTIPMYAWLLAQCLEHHNCITSIVVHVLLKM